MVKRLRFCWVAMKRVALVATILLLALAFWLHGGERSLAFAKPWIVSAINSPNAPYTIAIGDVTVDWSNVAMLGKIRLRDITLAKREGTVFAQLPQVYVTIDPIGFLPTRHLLHKIILSKPSLFMARNAQGVLELGIQDAPERMSAAELVNFLDGGSSTDASKAPTLPFHDFIIDDAKLAFTDEASQTSIISEPFDFHVRRRRGSFEAFMAMPFTVDGDPVKLSAGLRILPNSNEHVLSVQLVGVPSKLVCIFGACGNDIVVDGAVSGNLALGMAEDFSLHAFSADLSTNKAIVKAPTWFAEKLVLGKSSVAIEGNWAKQQLVMKQAKLELEDTDILASANIHKAEDGWYATVEAETGKVEMSKVYKYWPLTMAPDSRTWVTSKIKGGYASKGTLKLNLTPAEFAAPTFSDAAVEAMADAHDITFEYLPNFPLVEHMDGIAHFTGTTVKVDGTGGKLLSGTKISKATLWVSDLNNPHIPMETTTTLSAPASDAATMLALKHFTFDDVLGLDPKTIAGTVDATMKLKFNAFSNQPESDPNAIHLEAVDYDISTKLNNIAQKNLYGSYDVRALNGDVIANNGGLSISGAVMLGDTGTNEFSLNQKSGDALKLSVKGRASADNKSPNAINDFSLVYQSGAVPAIILRGKKIDASMSYDSSEHSLLANFPAMKLDIDVGELVLGSAETLRNVVGTLNCSAARCENADFVAQTAKGDVKGSIASTNGVRQLLVSASDAGGFLKALDVTDRMTKGKFELRGTYDDKKTPPQFNGRLAIKDFTLKNSQILGRILTIGSLTGLSNALTGDGIAFDKLVTNVTQQNGVVTLDKGAANGAAIGITLMGTVDSNTTKLNLKGVVVPAYALNSIVGKIPVIGLIAGGEGEGLIAFDYWVKGTYRDPEVGVNPLSGLTPGFLRGIFSIFDEKGGDTWDKKPVSSKPVGENQPSVVQKR